jgi:hypothetical protein
MHSYSNERTLSSPSVILRLMVSIICKLVAILATRAKKHIPVNRGYESYEPHNNQDNATFAEDNFQFHLI